MFNSNKFFAYLVGLFFLIAGLGSSLELLNIPFSSIILLLVGIITLCMYLKFNNVILKYISCFLIPTGFAYFVIAVFHLVGVANFLLIYFSVACAFFCVYLLSKKKIFLYIAMIIVMFALHTATNSDKNINKLIWGYDCFYIGLLTTILFIFEHKSLRYTPLFIAIVAYLGGVLNFLNALKIITPVVFKMLISLMFLLTGGFIIFYNYFKSKKQ